MRNIIAISFLLAAMAAAAQPVTHIRLITLQNPPDTATQYFIQAGGGRDTIKYVPIDSLGAGGDGNGIISALPAGDVSIAASSNDFHITDMDSLTLEAELGILIKSNDIWLSQSGPSTTNLHLSPFTNFTGTGYLNVNMGYFGVTVDDSLNIYVDRFNEILRINQQIEIDKFGGLELANFPSSFSSYSTTDEGKITYNETENVPMFWDGSAWNNLADAASVPAGWTSGYGEAHYNGSTTQSIANTFTVLNPMTAGDATGGWSWSTVTDQFTYTGDTEKYLIQFSFSAHCSTNTFDELTVSVRENSTETTARGQVECSNSGVTQSTSGSAIITANNGDTFDMGAYWTTSSSSNISIKHLNFIATKL